jgi:hypothetical protein
MTETWGMKDENESETREGWEFSPPGGVRERN